MARPVVSGRWNARRAAVNGRVATDRPRWQEYVLRHGTSFKEFWYDRLNSRQHDVLIIVGKGFDPRATLVAHALMELGGAGRRDGLALEFDEGSSSPSNQFESEAN